MMYSILLQGAPISFILLFLLVYVVGLLFYFTMFFYRQRNFSRLFQRKSHQIVNFQNIDILVEEIIKRDVSGIMGIEKHLQFLKLIVNLAPLLGLLGTVFGLVKSTGGLVLQDQNELLSGISQSLVTTAMGLIVSIPALLVHFYGKVKQEQLEEKVRSSLIKEIDL